ncbi:MAG TPA: nitrile hydratase accessory protein [Chloroflexota bacterium]|nr:nitrile hydratase accessory protein [Chloroflexota bacterium]
MSGAGAWAPPPLARLARLDEQARVPQRNGELVFAAPWEARAFGLVVALHEQGCFVWDEFKERLIAEITRADAAGEPSTYYERWLAALERLLYDKGLVAADEVGARAHALRAAPPDHP